jgi:enolase-phosphatase E1
LPKGHHIFMNSRKKISTVISSLENIIPLQAYLQSHLLPYIESNIDSFLVRHINNIAVQLHVNSLKELLEAPVNNADLAKNILQWGRENYNLRAFKALQAMIWEEGFQNKELLAPVCQDNMKQFTQWQFQDIKIYIYSRQAIQAQKGILLHTEAGELSELISGYFDLRSGSKTESDSYLILADELGEDVSCIMYVTPYVKEADAAYRSGVNVVLIDHLHQINSVKPYVVVPDVRGIRVG